MNRKSGFTLIELMTVVVIIAIVASITMASATYLVRNSRRQRAKVTCATLEAALARYHHEYGEWPVEPNTFPVIVEDNKRRELQHIPLYVASDRTSPESKYGKNGGSDKAIANKKVLSKLRRNRNDNGIQFIDETSILTADKAGDKVSDLSRVPSDREVPFAYRDPKTGRAAFFTVIINFADDTVSVEM